MMNESAADGIIPGSFRDPSGFLFRAGGVMYRQVNAVYRDHYDLLMSSGLYDILVRSGLLIPHEETAAESPAPQNTYKTIKPEAIPFVSCPFEWCFSQFKDAALATLDIQKKALQSGMSLKDCSAYNIQFKNSKPIFIDTLSFEKYQEGKPWVAYRQFCQHFLAPLALMSCADIRLSQLLRIFLDGIPLDLASSLLPLRTRFSFSLLAHIHLHAKSQKHFSGKAVTIRCGQMKQLPFRGLIDSLESAVQSLRWNPSGTEWADYYADTNYSADGLQHKKQIIADFLGKVNPRVVWDLGANEGVFSRIASDKGIIVVSFDNDPAAVEKNYLRATSSGEAILPLVMDLTNPTGGYGWDNSERMSLVQRGPADAVLALALVHHMAISNNVPLGRIAEFLRKLGAFLIIEFVPRADSQVQRLLSTREDVFPDYTQQAFENSFGKHFTIRHSAQVKGSLRTIYLMERIPPG